MMCTKQNYMYSCKNCILLFNYIWNIFINDVPYLLQNINNILICEIPRVWLLHNLPKEGRYKVLMPTMNTIGNIFVVENGLSFHVVCLSALLSFWSLQLSQCPNMWLNLTSCNICMRDEQVVLTELVAHAPFLDDSHISFKN